MREELWREKAALFAPFSGRGMTFHEVADRVGENVQTVRHYAKRFGFEFGSAYESDRIAGELRRLAEEGRSRKEAAQHMGLSYPMVIKYGIKYGIPFIHESFDKSAVDRAMTMAAMYKGGKTLNEIGALYGVSRERVRQLISKHAGLTGSDGGQSIGAQRKRQAAEVKRNAASLKKHGCTYDQYLSLLSMGRESMSEGCTRERSPIGAFSRQRTTARGRGIEWNLKLWDWWQIWQQSGKWSQRGRGKGKYVMCRFGDSGAYEPGNVYIATAEHNVSFQPNNPYRKSHPDHDKVVAEMKRKRRSRPAAPRKSKYPDLPVGVTFHKNRYVAQIGVNGKSLQLGRFRTPEEARQAYLRAVEAENARAAA